MALHVEGQYPVAKTAYATEEDAPRIVGIEPPAGGFVALNCGAAPPNSHFETLRLAATDPLSDLGPESEVLSPRISRTKAAAVGTAERRPSEP